MMLPSIVAHWRRLQGSVHEDDAPFFATAVHSFNLDFPPPAYVGDIRNAPVVLLDKNGGFDQVVTPSEFSDSGAVTRYLEFLHNPRPIKPSKIAPYYGQRNYSRFIESGELALVNAVAYRSQVLSKGDEAFAKKLPSTKVHREWLRSELMPTAKEGNRLIVAHRNMLWGLDKGEENNFPGTLVFSSNPASPNLSNDVIEKMCAWLKRTQ